jgi:hypothetical protein
MSNNNIPTELYLASNKIQKGSSQSVLLLRDRYLEEITQKSAQMTKNVQFGPEMTETISP